MAMAVAALGCAITLEDRRYGCRRVSFPGFVGTLARLGVRLEAP